MRCFMPVILVLLLSQSEAEQVQENDAHPNSAWWLPRAQSTPTVHTYSHAFHAKGNFVHVGCAASKLNYSGVDAAVLEEIGQIVPDLIGIGVQKGGTTDIFAEIVANRGWTGFAGMQFFNNHMYLQKPPTIKRVFGYIRTFKPNMVNIEKSPGYFTSESAPRRACETMPSSTKFILMLREPVGRAYSAYHQPPELFSVTTGIEFGVDAFHALAETEAEVVNKCNPFGTENHFEKVRRRPDFAACCEEVALSFGHAVYPCQRSTKNTDADGAPLARHLLNKLDMYPGNHFAAGFNIDSVRRGVYSKYIEMWLKYIEPERLLIVDSYDYFGHPDEVLADIDTFVTGVPNRGKLSADYDGCFRMPKNVVPEMQAARNNMGGAKENVLSYEACKAAAFDGNKSFFGMEHPESNHFKQYAQCWLFDAHPSRSEDLFDGRFDKVDDDKCGDEQAMMRGPPRRLGHHFYVALYKPNEGQGVGGKSRTRRRAHNRVSNGVRISKDAFHHSKNSKSGHTPMRNDTKLLLQTFYRPWNKKLEEIVGREMNWGY